MRNPTRMTLMVLLLAAVSTPAAAQENADFWRNKWFWGAQGGSYFFSAGGNSEVGFSAGGHWFITAGRSALYLGFDQLFLTDAINTLSSGTQVGFNSIQRVQASVLAMPSLAGMNIFAGGGFSIHHITDAEPLGAFATPQALSSARAATEALQTKAFFVATAGVQKRWRNRFVLFGQYQYMPPAEDFLITSAQHAVNIGLRYSLTHAEERVTTGR